MKKGSKLVLAIVLILGIFSGCASKKADNVVPKVEGKLVQEVEETKVEETVKVEKIGIVGAWQRDMDGNPEMLIIRDNGTATVFGSASQYDYVTDLLYDVKEVEKNIYNVNFYNIAIDTSSATDNKLVNGNKLDTMIINIVDKDNFQGAYKSFAKIYDYKKINSTMAESMMGTSIFNDKGYKSIGITADYLKLQDPKLEYFEFAGIQNDGYKQFFIYSTTFGEARIYSFYVNVEDLRLFTEDEYLNLNP